MHEVLSGKRDIHSTHQILHLLNLTNRSFWIYFFSHTSLSLFGARDIYMCFGFWSTNFKCLVCKEGTMNYDYSCQYYVCVMWGLFHPSRLQLGSTLEKWWRGWLVRGCLDIASLEIQSISPAAQKRLVKRVE